MRLLDRYLFRQTGLAFLVCLVTLTALIWVTQALRDFDLVTSQGQSAVIFLIVTGLAIPSLVVIIAPVALFIAAAWTLNRLNSDSELVVMTASGVSAARIARPLALLALLAAGLIALITLGAQPASMRQLRFWVTQVRADLVAKIVRPGQFTTVASGITFHVREHDVDGVLRGIFVQDARNPAQVLTYIAERGQIAETATGTVLVLEKGSVQRQEGAVGARGPSGTLLASAPAPSTGAAHRGGEGSTIVSFERYAFDLSQLLEVPSVRSYKPRELYTSELWKGAPTSASDAEAGRLRAELVQRVVAPLYVLPVTAIALATLGRARTTRQGRGAAVAGGIAAVMAVRILGFFAESLSARSALGPVLAVGIPLLATLVALALALDWGRPRRPERLVRPARAVVGAAG